MRCAKSFVISRQEPLPQKPSVKGKTVDSIVNGSISRIAAKRRVVSFIVLAMVLMGTGALVANSIVDTSGSLSLLWLMAIALLAFYWLRLVLADWTRRVDMQGDGDESAASARSDGA